MPEVPDKGLHRNRALSIPTSGGQPNCFSRTDILDGKTPAAWGSDQSAGIAVDGESKDDPDTITKNWYTKGRVLRVPKAVILSSFPQWTAYWPGCYFYFPRDVIGDDGFGQLGNYYYFDQWNMLDPNTTTSPDYGWAGPDASSGDAGYQNNPVWNQFTNLDPSTKSTIYNAQYACNTFGDPDCSDIPSYLMNICPTPPLTERYFQCVAQVENPYYTLHPAYMQAFLEAKQILESDPIDPIYVNIPNWLSTKLYQVRNGFLTQTHETLNGVHGGAVNGSPCNVFDAAPCYNETPICWAPPYPDINAPSAQLPFDGATVPWLMSADPGVGTNTLHIYIGHPNMNYDASGSPYDYQAWPLTPEMQWTLGPVASGNYLGSALPYFAGRRLIWRAFGFDYGYNGGITPQNLWDNVYGGLVSGAAEGYKQNFWKMRNMGVRLFTYNVTWNFGWTFGVLDKDRRNTCPATQFYDGFETFADFASIYDNQDDSISDCEDYGPPYLKVGETMNYFPAKADIDRAKVVGALLTPRVENYYNGMDPGSADFFKIAINETGLDDYNVSYEGSAPGAFVSAGGFVDYVREYFSKNH